MKKNSSNKFSYTKPQRMACRYTCTYRVNDVYTVRVCVFNLLAIWTTLFDTHTEIVYRRLGATVQSAFLKISLSATTFGALFLLLTFIPFLSCLFRFWQNYNVIMVISFEILSFRTLNVLNSHSRQNSLGPKYFVLLFILQTH